MYLNKFRPASVDISPSIYLHFFDFSEQRFFYYYAGYQKWMSL